MAAKKPCIRCSRSIDQWARICPFCNTDQEAPPQTLEAYESAYVAPSPKRTRTVSDFFRSVPGRVVIGLGIVALLGAAFAIGIFVYSLGAPSTTGDRPAQAQVADTGTSSQTMAADGTPGGLTLVPAGGVATSFQQPATAAPAPGQPQEQGDLRTDATALSSEVYARMAQAERARQEREQQKRANQARDPREIEGGPAWAAGQQPRPAATPPATQTSPPAQPETTPPEPAPARPQPETPVRNASEPEPRERPDRQNEPDERVPRTAPVPLSQPIPDVSDIDAAGTVRLSLTVDSSGRVKEVEIVQSVPGVTARLIDYVRRWRFRPATENGKPVQGVFPVEVSFNAE